MKKGGPELETDPEFYRTARSVGVQIAFREMLIIATAIGCAFLGWVAYKYWISHRTLALVAGIACPIGFVLWWRFITPFQKPPVVTCPLCHQPAAIHRTRDGCELVCRGCHQRADTGRRYPE